jgi:predicted DNA-binding protein YlxM (UPF0122 family)
MPAPVQLLDAWRLLSENERQIVEAYIEGNSFASISEHFGVSRQRIQQIYVRALCKLGVSEERRRELSMAHRAKINQALSEREITAERRVRMGTARRGNALSAAHRAAIGAKSRGRTVSPETRARMSEAQRGRTISAEHRAALSAAQLGKPRGPFSAESRAKMSAAQRARWARMKDKEPTA